MSNLSDYRCTNCGTVIHSGEMCDACEKAFYVSESGVDTEFMDYEFAQFTDMRDEMRALGMGR